MSVLVVLLLASASLAGEPAAGAAGPPDVWTELVELQGRHGRLVERFEPALAQLRDIRLAYQDAPDKAALAERWDEVFRQCQKDLVLENDHRREHRSRLNIVKLEILAKSVPVKGQLRANPDVGAFATRLVENEARASEMRARSHRLAKELDLESAAFGALTGAQLLRSGRRRLPWEAAGALALAGAAAAALWRRRRDRTGPPVLLAPLLTRRFPAAGANIELGELLGRGAMGEVYAGRDRTLDRRVAVKRLRPELAGSPAELEKLVAQARLMAGLKHPNVVQVHSVEREGGEAFLVLELAEGRTLAKLVAEDGALPWEEARRVVRAVAEGLDYAHTRGVTHGDLKPSNVMVAPDGRVKVMDFALAYAAKATVSRLTRSDAFGGLPYMSPEQELGEPSPAADAFALAACFYEALTARRPFPGPDFLAQKRAGQYVPASALAKRLPAGADALFKIAFHPDPERRFPGPAALAAAADAL